MSSSANSVKCVYVLSDIDGFKYKLVMEGDVRLLTVAKVKRYLHNATGLNPPQQQISFNGKVMKDNECGADVGLIDGAVLRLQHISTATRANSVAKNISNNNSVSKQSISISNKTFQGNNISREVRKVLTGEASTPILHNSSNLHSDPYISNGEFVSSSYDTGTLYHDKREKEEEKIHNNYYKEMKYIENDYRELEIENKRLKNHILDIERRLANASSDWRLQEEIDELKQIIINLQRTSSDFERVAEEKWRTKEEELVKELDLLREERRKLRREKAYFEQEQRALVYTLEEQIRTQRKELIEKEALLQRQNEKIKEEKNKTVTNNIQNNLFHLSKELNISPLKLDDNDTCVVPLDDGINILITLDPPTERIFMYATIASEIPSNFEIRLKLFEKLLEGALLGRDMAGGGVGICSRNNLIIMDVCVDMAHADEFALTSIARPFMSSVQYWLNVIKDVIS